MKVTVNEFSNVVNDILKEYADEVYDDVKDIVDDVTDEALGILKEAAPVGKGKRAGEYKKALKKKKVSETLTSKTNVLYAEAHITGLRIYWKTVMQLEMVEEQSHRSILARPINLLMKNSLKG